MGKIDRLFEIVQTLRADNGCAWDKDQTPETIWECLVEEVFELQGAIANKDPDNIREELGDVLFQLVFIIEIFQEKKFLELSDIIEQVAQKMIRRHPHVYADAQISTTAALDQQWDEIKTLEKKSNHKNDQRKISPESALDTIPRGMPALIRSLKVSKCVVKEGFDWDDINGVLKTVKDELDEFENALSKEDNHATMLEFGDILFSLVNVAMSAKFHPETALMSACKKFEGRYRLMEKQLKQQGQTLKDLSQKEIDNLWENAKMTYDTSSSFKYRY